MQNQIFEKNKHATVKVRLSSITLRNATKWIIVWLLFAKLKIIKIFYNIFFAKRSLRKIVLPLSATNKKEFPRAINENTKGLTKCKNQESIPSFINDKRASVRPAWNERDTSE